MVAVRFKWVSCLLRLIKWHMASVICYSALPFLLSKIELN